MKTKILFLGILLSLTILSCEKESITPSNVTEAKTEATIDLITDDISDIVDNQIYLETSTTAKSSDTPEPFLSDCTTFETSHIDNTWTRVVTFNHCVLPNKNVVDGQITISATLNSNDNSLSISYTFNNFYHNGILVEGNISANRSIKGTEILEAIHPVLNMSTNLTLTFPNGNVYHRIGSRTREMTEGYLTPHKWSDNIFTVTGNWSTTGPKGTRTATITTPLIIKMTCHNIVSGVITFTKNDIVSVLDYGNGDCDNIATVTVNDKETTITLPH